MRIRILKECAREITKLRHKHHFSQEQLATTSGLSLRTIQGVESGENPILETEIPRCVFEVEMRVFDGRDYCGG